MGDFDDQKVQSILASNYTFICWQDMKLIMEQKFEQIYRFIEWWNP